MSGGTVQRAFQLAEAGDCRSVGDIRRMLQKERFDQVDSHLSSPSLKVQLKRRIDAALATRAAVV